MSNCKLCNSLDANNICLRKNGCNLMLCRFCKERVQYCLCYQKCYKCKYFITNFNYDENIKEYICEDCSFDSDSSSSYDSDLSEDDICYKPKCERCSSRKQVQTVCCDCSIELCKDCKNDDDILCNCYGECTNCNIEVNRGENGWPCNECKSWLCSNCCEIKELKCIYC